jgi:predicted phosphoribosyltransferase
MIPTSLFSAFFLDLLDGGRQLANRLTAFGLTGPALVVGIVRGGVPAAYEVACRLDLPLDVLLLKSLILQPSGNPLRVASVAGTTVLEEDYLTLSPGSIEKHVFDDGVRSLTARAAACRGSRHAVPIPGKTIILLDNGMRTGRTMAAAIRAVRPMDPALIVAGVPASTPPAVELVRPLADQLLCLVTSAALGNVAMAYRRFDVPDESRIRGLLDRA